MKNTLAICALLAVIAGCASSGVQVKPDQLTLFKAGVTTEADVVQALGKPNVSTSSSDGTKTLAYSFAEYKIRGASFIPIVGMFAGGSDINMNSTVFTFDSAGKMLDYKTTESSYGQDNMRPRQESPR